MDLTHKIILSFAGLVIIAFAFIVGWQWYQEMPVVINDPGAVNIKLSQDFNLSHNQSAKFGDYVFTFSNVIGDSRCPEKATCFTAGDVTVEILVKKSNISEPIQLSLTGKPTYILGDYKLELISVNPYPQLNTELDKTKYKIGLVLIKRGGVIP